MRKVHLMFYMFVAISLKAFTQPLAPSNKHWEVVNELTDEFNGSSLDETKWRDFHPYWSGRGSTFRKYNVWVEGGSLRLKSTKNNNNSIDAACVSSLSPSMKVGYYSEARIWCPSMSMTGAYWFQSKGQAEIDVIENFGNATNHTEDRYRMLTNTHYFANGWDKDQKTPWYGGSDILKPYACDETYYVYGVWWKSENEIIFYCDGKEVHKVTTLSKFTESMYMFFDMEVFGWWGTPKDADLADPTKNTQYVDWVRTFKLTDGNTGNLGGNGISNGEPNTNHPVDPRVSQELIDVTGIQIPQAPISMFTNQSKTLTYNIVPSTASDKSVRWSSEDTSIAKINASGVITGVGIGNTKIEVKTNDGGFSAFFIVSISAAVQNAFPNEIEHLIPGSIEFEDFDNGGEGVSYHDVTSENSGTAYRLDEGVDIEVCNEGGYNIGWINDGEWLEYSVDVANQGEYEIGVRYAAKSNVGTMHIEFNGVDKTGALKLPVTNDWQVYNTVSQNIHLEAGKQIMRIFIEASGMNLNNITFTLESTDSLLSKVDAIDQKSVSAYPNPITNSILNISIPSNTKDAFVKIYNMNGLMLYSSNTISTKICLDDFNIRNGIYLLKITDGKHCFNKKIIVQYPIH